jgi:uncharacterized protein
MAAEHQNQMLEADRTLQNILRRLAQAYQPERIYLFGSRARGDSGPHSDYDLLVIVPDDALPERRQDRFACKELWDLQAAADVLVYRHSYFEARRTLKASLPGIVLREGKLLYGRETCSTMVDGEARVDDTKEWLRKAESDLKSADHLFRASPPILDTTLFHCQQAAEKALKAFLAWHDVPLSKTHIIKELGRVCIALDATLSLSVGRASSLTGLRVEIPVSGRRPGAIA